MASTESEQAAHAQVEDATTTEVAQSNGGTQLASETAEDPDPSSTAAVAAADISKAPAQLSKNAMKRLKRKREWEEGKDERRQRRKEKRHDVKARRRSHRDALIAQGVDPETLIVKKQVGTLVPVALILDCDFEPYMTEKELISLSSQVTRCYSDNKGAKYRSYLWIAGWKGKLKARNEDVLNGQYKNWRGVGYVEGDYLECAMKAREKMESAGGEMIDALRPSDSSSEAIRNDTDPTPIPDTEPEPPEEYSNVTYLTSDSPNTLERLEPNHSYVIGGIVDKNREKGLCYRRARERGIRTAKLPIGQFMVMQSRQVLTTNHVVEIMLRWLEFEDWGKAFLSVIPKRKGGRLRADEEAEKSGVDGGEKEEELHDESEDEEDEGKDDGDNEVSAIDQKPDETAGRRRKSGC